MITPKEKQRIFTEVRELLAAYEQKLEVRENTKDCYSLYGETSVQVGRKTYDGMYFSSVAIKKNFVSFYFFPIYTHKNDFTDLGPSLMACMKGKSCFNLVTHDPAVYDDIKKALEKGYRFYKKIGFA